MALITGSRLGPYEILGPIGAGGMGEVYKARDTRLNRTVAIKILPHPLGADPELRERFDREAKAIAALTHPHICTLYDVGHHEGIEYLVMEYLEGETLAYRLEKGALSLDQALRCAIEIADALDRAHRAGTVHRDLKPGNIMLTTGGAKLLDFGLAKATVPAGPAGDLSMLPTTPPGLTAQGTLLGTFQYMAPEQLEGHEADARTDIFAFGSVIYEMLTGKKAFEGKSQATLIAAIISNEPPSIVAGQPLAPPALDRVVKKSLAKAPSERWQSAKDLHDELQWIADPGSQAGVLTERAIAAPHAWRWALLAAVLALVAAVASWGWWSATRPVDQPLVRLDVDLGPDIGLTPLVGLLGRSVIISPDGGRLVYLASLSGGSRRLFTRRLDQPNASELPGSEGASAPFFSPDGQWVGFFALGALSKVSVDGGAVVPLGVVPDFLGASWGEDGTIILGTFTRGLVRMSATGGTPTPVMDPAPGKALTGFPHVLPGGKAVLVMNVALTTVGRPPDVEESNIEVVSLEDRRRKILVRGATGPSYLSSGHLAYNTKGTLFAIPFDVNRLETYGTAVRVLDGVASAGIFGPGDFDVSRTGTFVYRRGSAADAGTMTVQWLDRTGKKEPLWTKPGVYSWPRLSPDGTRLLLLVSERGNQDIVIYEWPRDTMTRLTFGGGTYDAPTWSPDGRFIIFSSGKGGMLWTRADGASRPQPFTESASLQVPTSFTSDGNRLAYVEINGGFSGLSEILTVSVEEHGGQLRAGKPEQFLKTPFRGFFPVFSPDGRWLAYQSDESGRNEVYVRPFPAPAAGSGGKWQISDSGGIAPAWSRTSRELLYRAGDQIMAVSYTVQSDSFVYEKPRVWARLGNALGAFDLSPNGTRVAILTLVERPETSKADHELVFLMNFFDELRRRAPVGK